VSIDPSTSCADDEMFNWEIFSGELRYDTLALQVCQTEGLTGRWLRKGIAFDRTNLQTFGFIGSESSGPESIGIAIVN
jgi:hypothetical protein